MYSNSYSNSTVVHSETNGKVFNQDLIGSHIQSLIFGGWGGGGGGGGKGEEGGRRGEGAEGQ